MSEPTRDQINRALAIMKGECICEGVEIKLNNDSKWICRTCEKLVTSPTIPDRLSDKIYIFDLLVGLVEDGLEFCYHTTNGSFMLYFASDIRIEHLDPATAIALAALKKKGVEI